MSNESFIVPALGRKDIRDYADSIRRKLSIKAPYFPIVQVVELIMPRLIPGFYLDICEEDEMTERFGRNCHGMTFPDEKVMHVRGSIYERARKGEGRDRLTLAHELAHLLLHGGQRFARRATSTTKPYLQSEWQANCFAGELLVSYRYAGACRSTIEAADLFKVSVHAAETQWKAFLKDGII